MSQIQPLDTYKIGGYRLPIPCHLCGENNLYEAVTCANCASPMDLSRSLHGNECVKPQLIVPVGAGDTGKTVYLGMLLDILSRQGRSDITTHGAASVTVQQTVIRALARQYFPEPTSREPLHWAWTHCRLARRTSSDHLHAFVPDMSGESILRDADDESFPQVRHILRKATGIMLFLDAGRLQAGDKDEEFFALKILRFIEGIIEHPVAPENTSRRKRGPQPLPQLPPVSVVLAKADECDECFDNPSDYVRGQMPNLWQALKTVAPQHAIFAASAVGAVADIPLAAGEFTKVPLRIEPRGILEPFRWLLGQFISQR